MGMYTSLRVKATVKEEFREMIDEINDGAEWCDYVDQFTFLSDYADVYRADFIPRGVLTGEPANWTIGEFPCESATDGFERKIDMATGYWTFQCSLINSFETIEHFLTIVLSNVVESVDHIEMIYEASEIGVFYKFVNGEIIKE